MNNNRLFEQQQKAREEKAREEKARQEAKARQQERQNILARAQVQLQHGAHKTSHLYLINTNQSPQTYNHAMQQALRQSGYKK